MFRTSNPVLNDKTFATENWGGINDDLARAEAKDAARRGGSGSVAAPTTMTIRGCAIKTGILLTLCSASAAGTWGYLASGEAAIPAIGLIAVGGITALVLSLIICFAQKTVAYLAPVHALFEGLFLGGISFLFAQRFEGIVGQAVGLTLGIAGALAIAFSFGLIRIGSTLARVVVIATGGLCLFYIAQMVLGLCGISFLRSVHGSGPIGIGFSLFVIALASFNLVMTFQEAERGIAMKAPKSMEWYIGFAVLVELAWLYLEVLKLLAKLRSDDD